ncbi:MAG TPA: metal-dependent hydrolase [Clostridia bacterium]|nr:metal-dependent hydrolase [Clostridia bacterium]HHY06210.1 metal-dependent hydrolase [Clostridia bacterium]
MLKLIYHGHACFSLTDSIEDLLIDPFLKGNPLADVQPEEVNPTYILVTHGHDDHLGDAVEIAQRTGAVIIAPNELAHYCACQGVDVAPMHLGGAREFSFGKIKLTPAWHSSAIITAEKIIYTGAPCGFIIQMQGKTIYHAGDTGLFGDLKLIGERYQLDYALLPIGDNFVMGPEDALEAAVMLQAKVTVPMHYDTFPLIKQDPYLYVRRLQEKGLNGVVLKPGESRELLPKG